MTGVTALKKVQLGKETAWGTAVAATAKLMSVTDASLVPMSTHEQSAELGTAAPSKQVALTEQHGAGSVEMDLSYEDILYPLHGLFGSVAPTGTDPYTYTYAAPIATAAAPQKYSVEFGAGTDAYVLKGGLVQHLNIAGEVGSIWKATLDLIGKLIATVTLAAPADRTIELIRTADTTLYVDAVGGTMGSTVVAVTLIGFELDVDSGRHLKAFAGAVNPGDFGEGKWEGTLRLTLEFTAAAKAYVDALLGPAKTERQIEIRATSGTKSAKLQFTGYLSEDPTLFGDRDGNIIVETTWQGAYNSTFANWLKSIIVNSVSTPP